MSDIPSWATVGREVVCVDASATDIFGGSHLIVGATYKIRWAGYEACFWEGDALSPSVKLVGLVRAGNDLGFRPDRFRPLISQADDLEQHFVRLLDAPLNHEREEA